MEFRELNYILKIAECGKVSAAAAELFIAQSSLSQFLKLYEEKLGFALFIRTNRGLTPTEEGKLYIQTAERILGLRREFFSKISDLHSLNGGSVLFSVSPFRAPYLLPQVIPAFTKAYPAIQLNVREGSMKTQEEWLAKNMVDVGFITIPMDNPALGCRPVLQEEILLAVPRNNPLCARAKQPRRTGRPWLEVKDLNGQDFLLYSVNHRLRVFAEQLFTDEGIEPRVIQSHNSFETLIRLADSGMGVTFLPETYLEAKENLFHFSIGENGCYRTLALGYPASGYISDATKKFSEFISNCLKRQQETAKQIP